MFEGVRGKKKRYHSNLESSRHSVKTRDVLGEEVTSQSNFGIVRSFDNFLLSLESVQSRERTCVIRKHQHVRIEVMESISLTESLFVVDSARVDLRENGRFVVVTRKIDLLSSYNDLSTVLDSVLNMLIDLVDSSLVNQRSVSDSLSSSFSDLEVSDSFSKLLREGFIDTILNVNSVRADAIRETRGSVASALS